MKRIILFSILIVFSALTFGQQSNFKSKVKYQPGTTVPKTKFKKINGQNNLKSSAISPYKMSSLMLKPDIQNNRGYIKKILHNNLPVYIEIKSSLLKSASIQSPEERFYSFFESIQSVTKLKNPRESFKISKIETDNLGMTHLKAIQLYKGIEIYGTEFTLHLDSKKERFTGRIKDIISDVNVVPQLSSLQAINNTVENLKQQTKVRELSEAEKTFLKYNSPKTKLVVFEKDDNAFSLAYEIEIRPNFIEVWKYFIDAHSGEILRKFNATNTADGPSTAKAYDLNNVQRTINTYSEGGKYYLIDVSETMFNSAKFEGLIMTLDANYTSTQNLNYSYITSTNNTWNSKTAVSAHANTMATYQYLEKTFGRTSLNGSGNNIISFINITNDDGSALDNAFWSGEAAFYGNGSNFKPLAGAQDVISHELGHGVVSNTANLEYYAQSGAINETFADFFGAMVDRDDWMIGEDIIKSGKPMRNMQDPHNGGTDVFDGWQPRHMSEIVTGSVLDNFQNRDQEGVHINSGIGNYAYYLLATAITKEKAEQIFYRALSTYLTKNTQFIDLRVGTVQAAKDLYGNSSNEVVKTKEAFDKVGIYGDEPVPEEKEYEVNDGEDFMLIYNTDDQYDPKLYRYDLNETLIPMTTTDMKGKVSVTDDGTIACYVSMDGNIMLLSLDPESLEEYPVTEEGGWDNVAISKDGNRIALISTEVDASIYVIDLVSETDFYRQFELYNPTTSEDNTTAGGVQYADEFEFDITGEYIIYDAYNELSSTYTDPISYWDIGFLKVWDNSSNSWGDGTISKLYGSLPEDVSIGNPVFSKNSANIIAFDYFDEVSEEYAVFCADLTTSDLDGFLNNTLGFPSYSRLDDLIAFTELGDDGNEQVSAIYMADNKISPEGDVIPLISLARWAVFYSTGIRTLGLPPSANFSVDYKCGDAPRTVRFIDASLYDPTGWKWSFTGGTPSTSTEQNPYVTYTSPGIFKVSLTASNMYGENTVTKTEYIEVYPTTVDNMRVSSVSFFPNPVTNKLNITCEGDFSFKLFNVEGQVIHTSKNQKLVDLSGFESGIYFIEIETENGKIKDKLLKL